MQHFVSFFLLVVVAVESSSSLWTKKSTDPDAIHSKVGDFDLYALTMHHVPEFCQMDDWNTGQSNRRFWGCRSANVTYKESWEGQLTIHGLWPNVSSLI